MELDNYIRGNSSLLYLIFSYKKLYVITDNFHRVFFLNGKQLKKVEKHDSNIITDIYELAIKLINNKNDKQVKEALEKTKLYKDFKSFIKEELGEDYE